MVVQAAQFLLPLKGWSLQVARKVYLSLVAEVGCDEQVIYLLVVLA